jgi:hypothetical protein
VSSLVEAGGANFTEVLKGIALGGGGKVAEVDSRRLVTL